MINNIIINLRPYSTHLLPIHNDFHASNYFGKSETEKEGKPDNGALSTMGNSASTTMEPSLKILQNYQFPKD